MLLDKPKIIKFVLNYFRITVTCGHFLAHKPFEFRVSALYTTNQDPFNNVQFGLATNKGFLLLLVTVSPGK